MSSSTTTLTAVAASVATTLCIVAASNAINSRKAAVESEFDESDIGFDYMGEAAATTSKKNTATSPMGERVDTWTLRRSMSMEDAADSGGSGWDPDAAVRVDDRGEKAAGGIKLSEHDAAELKLWTSIRTACEATAAAEPTLRPWLQRIVLRQPDLKHCLAHILADRLASKAIPAADWFRTIGDVLLRPPPGAKKQSAAPSSASSSSTPSTATRAAAAAASSSSSSSSSSGSSPARMSKSASTLSFEETSALAAKTAYHWPPVEGNWTLPELLLADLLCVTERDPACLDDAHPLLYFKGFQCLQAHRVAHVLWQRDRKKIAVAFQSRCSEVFGMDLHPAATIGRGVMFDHGTGIVVGETARIGDECSLLHGVTLGGTGKVGNRDRHPKLGNQVLVGAHASILGNVFIGERAKIGCGSVVLTDIPSGATAVGAPAKVVGRSKEAKPGTDNDNALLEVEPTKQQRRSKRNRKDWENLRRQWQQQLAGANGIGFLGAAGGQPGFGGGGSESNQRPRSTSLSSSGLAVNPNTGSLNRVTSGSLLATEDGIPAVRRAGFDGGGVGGGVGGGSTMTTATSRPSTQEYPHLSAIFGRSTSLSDDEAAHGGSSASRRRSSSRSSRDSSSDAVANGATGKPTDRSRGSDNAGSVPVEAAAVAGEAGAGAGAGGVGAAGEGPGEEGGAGSASEEEELVEEKERSNSCWRSIWRHLDVGAEGFLTPQQFHERLAGRGMEEGQVDELFFQLDADGNGVVSEEDFVMLAEALLCQDNVGGTAAGAGGKGMTPPQLPPAGKDALGRQNAALPFHAEGDDDYGYYSEQQQVNSSSSSEMPPDVEVSAPHLEGEETGERSPAAKMAECRKSLNQLHGMFGTEASSPTAPTTKRQ